MANVLIIDDDDLMCEMLCDLVENIHHQADYATTLEQGMEKTRAREFDVVFLDVVMPDGNGLDFMAEIKALPSSPEVIIMTGAGDMDGAELAIKNGAWDYLLKPIIPKEMVLPLRRVLQYRDTLTKSRKPQPVAALNRVGIVGQSPAIRAGLDALARTAGSEANVLITGETGTGKELFARAVHQNSARKDQPFVVVDCAALPETLVDSHLFGHEKASFTGAEQKRIGLVEQAHGGTLFLDEVGELPLILQKIFLRVLQEHQFRPVGGAERKSDFRLVAATNRDLGAMVKQGLFREDLFYRIRALTIEVPPLKNRREDIRDLTFHFVNQIFEGSDLEIKGFSPDFFKILEQYAWPGNVRELVHTLEASIASAREDSILFPKHLPSRIRIQVKQFLFNEPVDHGKGQTIGAGAVPQTTAATDDSPSLVAYKESREFALEKNDRKYFNRLIRETRGNLKQACRISGLGRTRLYILLKKYDISRKQ
jgi:two-component system NtrC family response regulator